jgi:hypothetical protein
MIRSVMTVKPHTLNLRPQVATLPKPLTFAAKGEEQSPAEDGAAQLKAHPETDDRMRLDKNTDSDDRLDAFERKSEHGDTPEVAEEAHDEIETLHYPPAEQYAAFHAEREKQKHLEWGKRFEIPARVLGWVENKLKAVTRRTTYAASDLSEATVNMSYLAVGKARKAAASALKSAAQSLEGKPSQAAEK